MTHYTWLCKFILIAFLSKTMRASDVDAHARANSTFQMLSSAQRSSVTREPLRGYVVNKGY